MFLFIMLVLKGMNKEKKLISDSVSFSFHRSLPIFRQDVCLVQLDHKKTIFISMFMSLVVFLKWNIFLLINRENNYLYYNLIMIYQ